MDSSWLSCSVQCLKRKPAPIQRLQSQQTQLRTLFANKTAGDGAGDNLTKDTVAPEPIATITIMAAEVIATITIGAIDLTEITTTGVIDLIAAAILITATMTGTEEAIAAIGIAITIDINPV